MHFGRFSSGSLRVDGSTYEQDVVIDRGEIRKRKKKPSKNSWRFWPYTRVSRRKDSLEMPPARDRHRNAGPPAGDERSET